jgi:hypothetical protein
LGDERFAVRQRAFQALADLRDGALPALRQARAGTLEQQRRIQHLLTRLQSIHIARLRIPQNVTLNSLDELVARELKNWRGTDPAAAWEAAQRLSDWAQYSPAALPALVEMLQDSREQVRELAVKASQRVGKRAANIMPELRKLERLPGAGSNAHIRQAIAAIEQAPDVADAEEQWTRSCVLGQQITEFRLATRERRGGQ